MCEVHKPSIIAGKYFLVVDDEDPLRELMARSIHQAGGLAVGAASAQVAISLLATGKPKYDVVVSDVRMPAATGLELVQQTRDYQYDAGILWLLVSGTWTPEEQDQARALGAYTLAKPFTSDQLLETIRQLLYDAAPTQAPDEAPGGQTSADEPASQGKDLVCSACGQAYQSTDSAPGHQPCPHCGV